MPAREAETGAERAAKRLAEKARANAATYAHLQPAEPSRQVLRRRALKARKAAEARV